MIAPASDNPSDSASVVPAEWPLFVADYYDSDTGYVLSRPEAAPQPVSAKSSEGEGHVIGGLACYVRAKGRQERQFAAIFSNVQWHKASHAGPSFRSDCRFQFGSELFDLSDPDFDVTWTNGLFRRRFVLARRGERVLDICYRRPWKHELMRSNRDSDLHGADDFFAYAAWVVGDAKGKL
jgi:hypothetical protein